MHSYIIERNKQNCRKKVYIILFIISFLITKFLQIALANIKLFDIPNFIKFWFSIPSFFGVFGIVYWVFNNYLWKWNIINKLLTVPNLSGDWIGFIKTSHNGQDINNKIEVKMEICQTWNQIKIISKTNNSSSESKLGGIITDKANIKLKFEYQNQPDYDSDENLYMHIGYNIFDIKSINNITMLTGKYFSGRSRKNHGVIKVIKKDSDLTSSDIEELLRTI